MVKFKTQYLWLIIAAYGVWFAVFSGFEEIMIGKYLKVIIALIFGIISYFIIEIKLGEKK
jgi:hypothetical protein